MSSALGKALGMTSTYTWTQVVSKIKGVANKAAYSKTFTPTTSKQTASSGAGYYSSISVACNAVSLSGNASNAYVLSGKTYYNTSLTKQTGTMVNRGAYTEPKSITCSTDPTIFYVRIPQGAYITNTSSGYPEIQLHNSLMADNNIGLRIYYTKYYRGQVNGFYNTETITIKEKGRFMCVFGGSYGYNQGSINGWGHVYSPSLGKLLPELAGVGGCAVSSGGGFVTVTDVINAPANTTVFGTLDNRNSNTYIGDGYVNLYFCVIGI